MGQVGAKVKIRWSANETQDSGWKPGWYTATVQRYCTNTKTITVSYTSEPDQTYDEELLPLLASGSIKLIWSPL